MASERVALAVLDERCRSCGTPLEEGHAEDCLLVEHEAMMAGAEDAALMHDPEECYWCLAAKPPVLSHCRCGRCCRQLLIEVDKEDARREPKIAERGSPILSPLALKPNGRELVGYYLNSSENGGACTFLDRATNLCDIYDSRPLVCRLFACDQSELSKDE